MLRFSISALLFGSLLCTVSAAAAQRLSPPVTYTQGEHTCEESVLRALADHPGRVLREEGRISLIPPPAMREVPTIRQTQAAAEVLAMINEQGNASLHVALLGEFPQVEERSYRDRRRREVEQRDRRPVRWIRRDVVELAGGLKAYRLDYVRGRGYYIEITLPFQGRTVWVGAIVRPRDPSVSMVIEQSLSTLLVHDCALPPDSTHLPHPAELPLAGSSADAICEWLSLETQLADGDPRLAVAANGRISVVPLEGTYDVAWAVNYGLRRRGLAPMLLAYGTLKDSTWVTLRTEPIAADLDSPDFQTAVERLVAGGRFDHIVWLSQEVVEQGGTRWLRLEFRRALRGVESHRIVYATAFEGRTLLASFVGPRGAQEALERSAATLNARDCRLVRPLRAWVDSAAVVRRAATLEAPQMPPNMKPLFRVTFDTAGDVIVVEPVFDQTPVPYADSVVAALRSAALRIGPTRHPTTHLVRVVGGATPVVDSPGVIVREPQMRDPERVGGQVGDLRNMLILRPETRRLAERGFHVSILVQSDGKVDRESVQLLRGSGSEWLDDRILRIARGIAFHPGEVDGFATSFRVVLPMSVY